MTFTELIWYFAIYSLIGWIWETVYLSLRYKRFIDTGFLKGPFCPLYGTSAILIVIFLSPFQNSLSLFFVLAILLTTLLEYLTSLIIESIFKIKFWDYSDMKFNLQGRVALLVSIFWGILSFILIKFIHPQISSFINHFSFSILITGAIIFIIYFLIDTIYTTISLFGLKKILKTIKILPNLETIRRRQIRFFKSFPQISSRKFDLVKEISQKINDVLKK